jgi:hypothetical protein
MCERQSGREARHEV